MRIFKKFAMLGLLAGTAVLFGCSADDPSAPEVTETQLEFDLKYGALGNSLTAGFINGALVLDGQEAGYANYLAAALDAGRFEQPLIGSPGISSTPFQGMLYVDGTGAITADSYADPFALLLNATNPVPYENLGIPGATTSDMLNVSNSSTSLSGANSFFDLILRNFNGTSGLTPSGSTQLSQMKALAPNVLTIWIGANDVLGGAMKGTVIEGQTVTPVATFEVLYDMVLDSAATIGASVVAVANIPSITSAPFFTTVPTGTMVGDTFVRWEMDEDDDGDADSVQYVLLTAPVSDASAAPSYLPAAYGGTMSLPDSVTLTRAEVTALEDLVNGYNAKIASEAGSRSLVHVDMHAEMADLAANPTADLNAFFPWGPSGQNLTSAFSLDGIHPSEKGQARIANKFIEAFNAMAGMSLESIDEAGVSNTIGFENSPGFVPPHGGGGESKRSIAFDESALAVLNGMSEMFGGGF